MDEKTLTALRGSIEKWEKIVDGGRDPGVKGDALCRMFLWNSDTGKEDCMGCPVREETGQPYCEDTPYEDYRATQALHSRKQRRVLMARLELLFLRSLLPPEAA